MTFKLQTINLYNMEYMLQYIIKELQLDFYIFADHDPQTLQKQMV